MYILQLSDLHISDVTDKEELREKIVLLAAKMKEIVSAKDSIVCCVLGDIVDRGKAEYYPIATEVLTLLSNQLEDIVGKEHLEFIIIPGNHDLCTGIDCIHSLSKFNDFATSLTHSKINYSDSTLITENVFFGYHFINICSVRNGNNNYGELDYGQLSNCKTAPNTIVLVHHSLVSSDKEDNAVIRNGYMLQQFLENDNIIALLHGHTHGCKRYAVGHDCQVIGVGPMFKPVHDVSNQCNLLYISGSIVKKITTLIYQADRKTWDTIETYKKQENNNYYGSSVYHLYEQVLLDADANLLLPNLRIQVKQDFKLFEAEILDKFASCLEEANDWQSFTCPQHLDYTHAELMNNGDIHWDQFAIDKLKENPTNKRTVIPLITKEMSFKSGDGKLVSFDIVQFGFLDNTCSDLYITVYLRALEIRHFLPINICEVYLMAKKIKESLKSVENISLCLFAFRAEAKKNYGCYKKSKIEMLSESELCRLLADHNFKKLKSLLAEKAQMGDTVIDETWLINLDRAFDYFYTELNRTEVLEQMRDVFALLLNLKSVRANSSNYAETQLDEDKFTDSLAHLIEMLPDLEANHEK